VGKQAPFQAAQQDPHRERCPSPEPSSMYPSGSPAKEHTLPGFPNRAPTERDATFLEPSLNYFSKLPVNGPPSPPGSPVGSLWRHLFPEPSATLTLITHLSLKVPSKRAPSMFPNRVPMERDAPSSEPVVNSFIYISQSSQ